jgi:hypothetical protein
MGDQKAYQTPELNTEQVAAPPAQPALTVEPVERAEQSLLGVRLGNTLAGAGAPPPDTVILSGSGLSHPTGGSRRATLARTLLWRRGNGCMQRLDRGRYP